MSAQWHSFHLYFYNESKKDELIVRMGDHLRDLTADGVVSRWFFIRYWDGGPHLRLRVKCRDEGLKRVDRALADLSHYILEHKSDAFDSAAFMQATSAFRESSQPFEMYDEGQIVPIGYEPEFDRYGGPDLMPLTEELFQLSSELTVYALSRVNSFSEKLIWAFALMRELSSVVFAHSLLSESSTQLCRDNITFWSSKGISPSLECASFLAANSAAIAKLSSHVRQNSELQGLLGSMEVGLGQLLDELERSRFPYPGYTATSHLHMLNNRMGCSPQIESAFYQVLLDV